MIPLYCILCLSLFQVIDKSYGLQGRNIEPQPATACSNGESYGSDCKKLCYISQKIRWWWVVRSVAVLISFPCDEYCVWYVHDTISYPDLREMQVLNCECKSFCLYIMQCVVTVQHSFYNLDFWLEFEWCWYWYWTITGPLWTESGADLFYWPVVRCSHGKTSCSKTCWL